MEPTLCFIRESYFKNNASFVKMLDAGNTNKQSKRTHLCVLIELNSNKFYIPLRNNLGDEVRKFGRIGHSVPSNKRKDAGLDYRYALIVNDEEYIELQTEQKIPESQYRKIQTDYETINEEFKVYVNGFIKAVKKNRVEKEPLYRESSLINFKKELGFNIPITIEEMTTEELNVELEKGYTDMAEGQTVSAKQAFANTRKELTLQIFKRNIMNTKKNLGRAGE